MSELVQAPQRGALAIDNAQTAFTDAQLAAFGIAEANLGEQLLFLHTVQRTGLDPAARQIYMIGRWSREGTKYTIQTGIDGYRLIAARTGVHMGTDDAVFTYDANGQIVKATVTVWKQVQGARVAFQASAFWSEYVQTTRDGKPTSMWAKMGHTMIAKCAEALALRKAFPQDLSGLYTAEEMSQADPVQVGAEQVYPPAETPLWDDESFARLRKQVEETREGTELNALWSRLKEGGKLTDQVDALIRARAARLKAAAELLADDTVDAVIVEEEVPVEVLVEDALDDAFLTQLEESANRAEEMRNA